MKSNLTDRQKLEICKQYLTGKFSYTDLGKELGLSRVAIHYIIKKYSGQLKGQSYDSFRRAVETNKKKYQRTHKDASRVGKPPKYSVNEKFFNKINTEQKAYMLGFLYADGSNDLKKNTIQLALKDDKSNRRLLNTFRRLLKSNAPIYEYDLMSFGKPVKQIRIHWSNEHLSERLSELGCVPNKSLIVKFPSEDQVPESLLKHFLRGYVDGNGSISSFDNPTKQVRITSSDDFCGSVKRILTQMGINCYIRKENKVAVLTTNGKYARMFANWLYYDSKIHLKRKYLAYQNLVTERVGNQLHLF